MRRTIPGMIAILLVLSASLAEAQSARWVVGGRLGLSISTGGGTGGGVPQFNAATGRFETASSTQAGLQIGPTAEVIFAKQFAIVTEFNINTQAGTPIEWANMFKAYFAISGSKILPYADGGFSLLFVTGGPWFGIRAGGGALFPIAKDLYIPADLQLGPIFVTGSTIFFIEATTGIRYII